MKVVWNSVEPPIEQGSDPRFTLDSLVVTVKKFNGGIMKVVQTSATCHPNGDSNLVIEVE